VIAVAVASLPVVLGAQETTRTDTLTRHTLPPVHVSATRSSLPPDRTPYALSAVERVDISRARPTWGLDEALLTVPGVYTANRYNFSLDQRLSIRGMGSRSAFAVRGVKVLVDGIPQTLPDGQGQLTNLDLGLVDRIEVLRGASSALYGNASGGVISVWTNPLAPSALRQETRFVAGSFDRRLERTWGKWQSTTRFRLGQGSGLVHVSRLAYEGERDHSAADVRYLNTRFHLPLPAGWSLAMTADVGDQPRADNPGALTADELLADRDQAAALNLSRRAGKDVSQAQAGVTLRHEAPGRGEAALTLFGLTRDLANPQTFAYIGVDRAAWGSRLVVTRELPLGALAHRLTAGLDFQRLRDDRVNYGNVDGEPDTTRLLDQLEHVSEIGPFVQSTLDLAAGVAATAGVRYDRVSFRVRDRLVSPTNPDDSGERVMDALSGSLGLSVTGATGLTLYANAGSSFETPTTTELANRPDTAGGFNAALEPQRAWSYEVGLRGGRGGTGEGGGGLAWSVALFRMDVRDMLVSYEVATSPQRRFFRNAGRARHVGVELGARARYGALDLALAWTFSDFQYTDYTVSASGRTLRLDGRALPGVPEHWLRLLVRAQPRLMRGAWAELEQTVSSGYLVDDTTSVRTDPWTSISLRAGWEGRVGAVGVSPFVGLNNAFNAHYVASVVINAARGRYYEPAPGRSLYIGASVVFICICR
jgi:iron complex outermembrane receptor protein